MSDVARASSIIGKNVLVGLTYVNADGSLDERVQFYARITAFDPNDVVTLVRYDTGEEFTLPPELDAFEEATPGEYRLHTTGEVIVDPDLISTWTIAAPEDDQVEQEPSEQSLDD